MGWRRPPGRSPRRWPQRGSSPRRSPHPTHGEVRSCGRLSRRRPRLRSEFRMLACETHVRGQPPGRASPRRGARLRTRHPRPLRSRAARPMPSVSWISPSAPGVVSRSAGKMAGVEHIPAHHGQIALGLGCGRLLDQSTHTVQLATRLGDLGAAVPGNLVLGHPHQTQGWTSQPARARSRAGVASAGRRATDRPEACRGRSCPPRRPRRRARHRRGRGAKPGGRLSPGQVPGLADGAQLGSLSALLEQPLRAADPDGGGRPAPPCLRRGRGSISSAPEATASSAAHWITGRSRTGSNSLGSSLVAGRKRVPRPAAGITHGRESTAAHCRPSGRGVLPVTLARYG